MHVPRSSTAHWLEFVDDIRVKSVQEHTSDHSTLQKKNLRLTTLAEFCASPHNAVSVHPHGCHDSAHENRTVFALLASFPGGLRRLCSPRGFAFQIQAALEVCCVESNRCRRLKQTVDDRLGDSGSSSLIEGLFFLQGFMPLYAGSLQERCGVAWGCSKEELQEI